MPEIVIKKEFTRNVPKLVTIASVYFVLAFTIFVFFNSTNNTNFPNLIRIKNPGWFSCNYYLVSCFHY